MNEKQEIIYVILAYLMLGWFNTGRIMLVAATILILILLYIVVCIEEDEKQDPFIQYF